MLTREKLTVLMGDLESEIVERTRAFDKMDKMGQAISAFANDLPGRGVPGYLLLGVENDGRLSGKRVSDEQMTSLGGLKTEGALLPSPSMSIEKFSFEDGDVVVIEVFPSVYPPIRFKGQAWVRVGARKALAADEDLHILEERRQLAAKRFEILPCEGARLQDLDVDLFRNLYLPRAIQAEIIESDPRPVEEQLAALRFYDPAAGVPTNLGMILFGRHPEIHIPSAYIQYVKFGGADNGADILAEHAYKGPLLQTVNELNAFVKVGIVSPRPVRISALQEKTVYSYPEWAIRELLLNAIIHRDYQIGNAPIKFYDYNGQRLELSNPGGLFGLAKPENFPTVNDYRNPLLAEAMKVMGFVNKFNRGIAKVKTEMERNGNPGPVFDVNKLTEFRVTLMPGAEISVNSPDHATNGSLTAQKPDLMAQKSKITAQLPDLTAQSQPPARKEPRGKRCRITPDMEAELVRIVSTHPGIRRKEMSEALDISLGSLRRLLAKMIADPREAKIEHRGSKKTGGWFRRA